MRAVTQIIRLVPDRHSFHISSLNFDWSFARSSIQNVYLNIAKRIPKTRTNRLVFKETELLAGAGFGGSSLDVVRTRADFGRIKKPELAVVTLSLKMKR